MTNASNWTKKTLLAAMSALLLVVTAGPARAADDMGKMDHDKMDHGDKDKKKTDKKTKKEPAKEPAKDPKKAGQTMEMRVTDKGFEPAALSVKKGEPVTLVITRMTDKTCATDIVIDEAGINTKLPLNKAVNVTFTPKKAGELKYGCAMNKMIGGVLSVQ